jgi:hypothetical protein
MKRILNVLGIPVMMLSVWACTKDFIVKNIKNELVTIIAPADNTKTPSNSITFWWEELEGAEKYNLQIVKPSFSGIQSLLVDSNITGTKFKYSLQPGSYQWRIKAINNGGSTQYTIYNLVIDTTSNLSTQLVIPIAPATGSITNSKFISFSWNNLSSATNYEIMIEKVTGTSTVVIKDTTTTNSFYNITLATEGNYQWKLKAFNSFSISQFNTLQTFTIDLTAPGNPTLLSPTNASMIKDTIYLKWTRASVTNTITGTRYDSVYVYNDSSLSSIASYSKVYDTKIKIQNLAIPLSVSSNYWWRVKSVDSVENRSGFSNSLKFRLN